MRLLHIAACTVELHPDGLTVTVLPDGSRIDAVAQTDQAYLNRASDLGYGKDVDRMSRDHEVAHSLLAELLDLPASPTLTGVARGEHWSYWREEEGAVLALQRLAGGRRGGCLMALAAFMLMKARGEGALLQHVEPRALWTYAAVVTLLVALHWVMTPRPKGQS